jgi:hypothetical protein
MTPAGLSYGGAVGMSSREFYEHAMGVADVEGRVPLSRLTGWEIFPFERDGLRVVPLQPPAAEPPRDGEDGRSCRGCDADLPSVWSDEHWRLRTLPSAEASGAPLMLTLEPVEHYDLASLPDERARELGVLVVHIARAVEALDGVARCHVLRYGDGGAHLHVCFLARPAGFAQLRGTCMAIWDDLLPAVPVEQRDADAATVAEQLAASYGGHRVA